VNITLLSAFVGYMYWL